MRPLTGLSVVLAVLAIWAGFRAWHSASIGVTILAVAAFLIGGNLIFTSWLWSRTRSGSAESQFLPLGILLQMSMLTGIVPRLWPANENVQIAASLVSIVITTVVVIAVMRTSRRLRAARRPG
jgi:hypothetical protein